VQTSLIMEFTFQNGDRMATATRKGGDGTGSGAGLLGSLAHTPLAEVLRRIVLQELSGDLQVTIPNAIKTVYFDRGFVVFASSDLKSDRLGESMIEAGRLSRQEFALASMLVKNTKRKFGQVLVDAGIVEDEELGRYVAAQVNRIVLSLFSAKKGVYSFDERPTGIPVELMVSLSSYRILIEGVRRMSRKTLVLAGLPSLDTRVEVTEQPPFSLDVEKLHDAEKRVLRAVGEGATLRQVVDTVGGNEGVALRACYGLLCGGVLEAEVPDARAQLLHVQEETGTFVLSEIRQKISKAHEEEVGEVPAAAFRPLDTEPALVSPTAERAEPSPSPTLDAQAVSPPLAETGHERPAIQPTTPSAEPSTETGGFFAWLASLFEAALRFLGRLFGAVEAPKERATTGIEPPSRPRPRRASAESGVPEVVAPVPAPTPPPKPNEPPTMESIGVPTWSMKDPSAGEQPVDRNIGAPSWSMKDDPTESVETPIETLGTPSWSMKDDPNDAKPKRKRKPEPKRRATTVAKEVKSRVTPPVAPPTPVDPPAASPPVAFEVETESRPEPIADISSTVTDETLKDLDNELFIEDVDDIEAPSMLSQIPVESVAVDEEDIEIEVEIDEESLVELAESQPEPLTPEPAEVEASVREMASDDRADERPPMPAATAVEKEEEKEEEVVTTSAAASTEASERSEESAAASRAREMNRIKQSGGESRLLRDVKLHFRLRDWEGAVPLLQQLVEISPGKALYRGMLARAMSRHPALRKEAEEHFVEALRLSPQDPELHYWLGIYYKSFGLKARATTEFRTTLRINPKHEGARKQLFGDGKKDDALGTVMKKLFG
jgi:hypothetical protein